MQTVQSVNIMLLMQYLPHRGVTFDWVKFGAIWTEQSTTFHHSVPNFTPVSERMEFGIKE